MTFDLAQRVTDFVAANPGCTLEEVARGVRARTSSVRDVLSAEAFFASPRDSYPSDRAQVYRLALKAADGAGRAVRRSQCDLIAQVLADGIPHSTSEIHRRCGFSRLNSRIAELRKRRGMIISCDHIEGAQPGPDAQTYTFHGFKEGFGTSQSADASAARAAEVRPCGVSADSDVPVDDHSSSSLLPQAGASEQIGEAA